MKLHGFSNYLFVCTYHNIHSLQSKNVHIRVCLFRWFVPTEWTKKYIRRLQHSHTHKTGTMTHMHTHIPSYGIVEVLWQHKVLPVYEEVLYHHPQGEKQVEGSKQEVHNCEPICKHWHKGSCCTLKSNIHTVRDRSRSERENMREGG